MVEIALSFAVLFLLGVVAITIKGGWDLQKKVQSLEQYAYVVTKFSHEISNLPDKEVNNRFKIYMEREMKKMRGE
jgi:hypothetical protein